MSDDPDNTIELSSNRCGCGHNLSDVPGEPGERRQVFDLPEEIKLNVTEYRSISKVCPVCGQVHVGEFPESVRAAVQYGPRVQAASAYMTGYQLLPFERTSEFFRDIFGHDISPGTLHGFQKRLAGLLERPMEEIRRKVAEANVAHFDETGLRVNGKRYWLHVVSTPGMTFYFVHESRGREAINEAGVLPGFHGIAVHDHYSSYYTYDCRHAECCAHILRELKFLFEERDRLWAGQLSTLLTEAKELTDRAREEGHGELPVPVIDAIGGAYDKILAEATALHPAPSPVPGKRGKPKATREYNLISRLIEHKEETLRFVEDLTVPFDNNLAERDVRMMKTKQKISGCFRTETGADDWCRIRGFISTVRKNGGRALAALADTVKGAAMLPARC
jgi:transposase